MFLLVPSDQPDQWKAKISADNLTISWDQSKGVNPPWDDLYMPEYDVQFRMAFLAWYHALSEAPKELPGFIEGTPQLPVEVGAPIIADDRPSAIETYLW